MKTTHVRALAVVAVLSLAACDEKKPTPPPAPPPVAAAPPAPAPTTPAESVPPAPGSTPTVPAHMRDHFNKALDLQQAVIKGNLPEFKAAAVWMAEHQLAESLEYPAAWKEGVGAMQEAARQGRDAAELKAAAAALGSLGAACASCHVKVGGPKGIVTEPPAEGSGTAPHMKKHQWAADTLWTGLMAPSDDAWVKGAEGLASAPLTAESVSPKQTVSRELAALAQAAHALGEKARGVERPARGAAYAALLERCSGCHQALPKK